LQHREGMATGVVLLHVSRPAGFLARHEGRTLASVARSVAKLTDLAYGGERLPAADATHFLVPDNALVRNEAERLGVRSAADLFGGIVPHPFVKTKIVTHDLVNPGAAHPAGWSAPFADRVREVVLPGYSVFARDDARRAVDRLLRLGSVRVKLPVAAGGHGQSVVRSPGDMERLLDGVSDGELAEHGLLLEMHLERVTTLSIGRAQVGEHAIAYHGRQRLTRDNAGRWVYGGSELHCVRGGWDALRRVPVPPRLRMAIEQARRYDEATSEYGIEASRRNYDVGLGIDSRGYPRAGVFEASWRVGGASPAEIVAMEALATDRRLASVRAVTIEAYGGEATPPPHAVVHFDGTDPEAGRLARYSLVRESSPTS
jgi:hypothetical protein